MPTNYTPLDIKKIRDSYEKDVSGRILLILIILLTIIVGILIGYILLVRSM